MINKDGLSEHKKDKANLNYVQSPFPFNIKPIFFSDRYLKIS